MCLVYIPGRSGRINPKWRHLRPHSPASDSCLRSSGHSSRRRRPGQIGLWVSGLSVTFATWLLLQDHCTRGFRTCQTAFPHPSRADDGNPIFPGHDPSVGATGRRQSRVSHLCCPMRDMMFLGRGLGVRPLYRVGWEGRGGTRVVSRRRIGAAAERERQLAETPGGG